METFPSFILTSWEDSVGFDKSCLGIDKGPRLPSVPENKQIIIKMS